MWRDRGLEGVARGYESWTRGTFALGSGTDTGVKTRESRSREDKKAEDSLISLQAPFSSSSDKTFPKPANAGS